MLLFFPILTAQSNYYALEINGGNDSLNNGSINSPFRTVTMF